MWTHVSLNAHIVWDDALWTLTALWVDDPESEPIALERSGRVPLGGDDGPQHVITQVLAALSRPGEGRLVAPAAKDRPL
jgi:hypothetical protein